MTDWTLLYREIVRLANPHVETAVPSPEPDDQLTTQCKSIALELRTLEKYLFDLRPHYLALTGPNQLSEKEKNRVDYEIKGVLQSTQQKIRALEKLEHARAEAAVPRSGLTKYLANPKIQGTNKTLSEHRQGMFYYLSVKLQHVSALLADIHRVRLARQAPFVTETVHQAAIKPVHLKPEQLDPVQTAVKSELESSQSQSQSHSASELAYQPEATSKQQLLQENDELMGVLNATLDKAQQAEQSLREIAEMQTELSTHLSVQAEKLSFLQSDIETANQDIGGANSQLENAKRRNRRASKIVTYSAITSAVILLLIGR